jgi:uncharacterized protein YjbI with pentapeptide repeats
MNDKLRSQLRTIILAEITKYQKVTGQEFPRWKDQLAKHVDQGNFVTFTDIPELSLNPVNNYGTPTGIYCYELATNKMSGFATTRPYAIVFRPKPGLNILKLGEYSETQFDADAKKLEAAHPDEDLGTTGPTRRMYKRMASTNPGRAIWKLTEAYSEMVQHDKLTKLLDSPRKTTPHERNVRQSGENEWTKLFLNVLGYHGVIDPGAAIIHENEPSQAVFWHAGLLQVVELVQKSRKGWSADHQNEKNPTQQKLTAFKQAINSGTVEGLTWPELLPFDNETVKNVSFKHSEFTPKSMVGSTFENVSFIDTTFWAFGTKGAENCTFKNVRAASSDPDSFLKFLGRQITNCTFIDVHATGFAPGKIVGSKITNMSFSNVASSRSDVVTYSLDTINGMLFSKCLSSKLRMQFSEGTAKNVVFEGCQLGELYLSEQALFDAAFKDTTIKNVYLHGELQLNNVDFTGLKVLGKFSMTVGNDSVINNVKLTRELYDKLEAAEPIKARLTVVDG